MMIGNEEIDNDVLDNIETEMLIGISKIDITPPFPTDLAGYALRDHKSEGIHDPIFLITYYFKSREKRLAICSFDVCNLDEEIINKLRIIAEQKFNLNEHEIVFSTIHNHHAPVISHNPIFIGNPERFQNFVLDKFQYGLELAIDQKKLQSVIGFQIQTELNNIGINRRLITKKIGKKIVELKPNPNGPIDKTLVVILFLNKKDFGKLIINPIGLIFKYSCHPVILGPNNYLITAEWPGVARNMVDNFNLKINFEFDLNDNLNITNPKFQFKIKENITFHSIYLQGTCADINPKIISRLEEQDNFFKFGTYEDVTIVGTSIAESVNKSVKMMILNLISIKNYKESKYILNNPFLYSHLFYIEVPLQRPPNIGFFLKLAKEKASEKDKLGILSKWAERMIQNYKEQNKFLREVKWPFHFFTFDKKIMFIGIGGEPVSKYSEIMSETFSEFKVISLGYVNEYHTYLPTKSILKEGGYEADGVVRWTNLPSSIDYAVDKIILKNLKKIKSFLFSQDRFLDSSN